MEEWFERKRSSKTSQDKENSEYFFGFFTLLLWLERVEKKGQGDNQDTWFFF